MSARGVLAAVLSLPAGFVSVALAGCGGAGTTARLATASPLAYPSVAAGRRGFDAVWADGSGVWTDQWSYASHPRRLPPPVKRTFAELNDARVYLDRRAGAGRIRFSARVADSANYSAPALTRARCSRFKAGLQLRTALAAAGAAVAPSGLSMTVWQSGDSSRRDAIDSLALRCRPR